MGGSVKKTASTGAGETRGRPPKPPNKHTKRLTVGVHPVVARGARVGRHRGAHLEEREGQAGWFRVGEASVFRRARRLSFSSLPSSLSLTVRALATKSCWLAGSSSCSLMLLSVRRHMGHGSPVKRDARPPPHPTRWGADEEAVTTTASGGHKPADEHASDGVNDSSAAMADGTYSRASCLHWSAPAPGTTPHAVSSTNLSTACWVSGSASASWADCHAQRHTSHSGLASETEEVGRVAAVAVVARAASRRAGSRIGWGGGWAAVGEGEKNTVGCALLFFSTPALTPYFLSLSVCPCRPVVTQNAAAHTHKNTHTQSITFSPLSVRPAARTAAPAPRSSPAAGWPSRSVH